MILGLSTPFMGTSSYLDPSIPVMSSDVQGKQEELAAFVMLLMLASSTSE
jgi:hypothetical protein